MTSNGTPNEIIADEYSSSRAILVGGVADWPLAPKRPGVFYQSTRVAFAPEISVASSGRSAATR